jgi:hypothetical protein
VRAHTSAKRRKSRETERRSLLRTGAEPDRFDPGGGLNPVGLKSVGVPVIDVRSIA